MIPGDVRRDGKGWLSASVDVDLDGPCRVGVVGLKESVGQSQADEDVAHLAAEVIPPDAADNGAGVAELVTMEGEVEGGPARLLAARQQVPEDFSQSDDLDRPGHVSFLFRSDDLFDLQENEILPTLKLLTLLVLPCRTSSGRIEEIFGSLQGAQNKEKQARCHLLLEMDRT